MSSNILKAISTITVIVLISHFSVFAIAKTGATDFSRTAHIKNSRISQASTHSLAQTAYEKAENVFQKASAVHYEHLHKSAKDQVQFLADGSYEVKTDCSGFISYIVHAIAPKHYEAVRQMQPDHNYPQAKIYAKFFAELPSQNPYAGWLKITNIHDLNRGDIIAWEKGEALNDHSGHGNSGHVMLVAAPPDAAQEAIIDGQRIRYVNVLVLDSSSVYHFAPEELPPLAHQEHRDGLGKGCIRLILNSEDKPIAYWEGTYWGEGGKNIGKPSFSQTIHFARLVGLNNTGSTF